MTNITITKKGKNLNCFKKLILKFICYMCAMYWNVQVSLYSEAASCFLKNEAGKPLLLWLQAVRSVRNKAINSSPMFHLRGVNLVKFQGKYKPILPTSWHLIWKQQMTAVSQGVELAPLGFGILAHSLQT